MFLHVSLLRRITYELSFTPQSPYVASSPAGEPKTEIEVACVSASILEVVNLLLRKRTKTEFCPYEIKITSHVGWILRNRPFSHHL